MPDAGSLVVRAAVETDPRKRVVITGMGVVSCFGNDVDTFYDRCVQGYLLRRLRQSGTFIYLTSCWCSLLEGKSGVGAIDRFDATAFPTNFGAQIRNFDNEGCAPSCLDYIKPSSS